MNFSEEFVSFLTECGFQFSRIGDSFLFPENEVEIIIVQLDISTIPDPKSNWQRIYIFEDKWRSSNSVLKERIAAHLGRFRSIFARKCDVQKIDASIANAFLEINHFYGGAKSKYKYGLFLKDELVAVSEFSASRPMQRSIGGNLQILNSYEWVRYASLPNCRISGGMGKMLSAFISDQAPDEIMSYADREWSGGDAYIKLGFFKAGERSPVKFFVNKKTFERISQKKLLQDKAYRNISFNPDDYVEIQNLGSIKYLLQPSLASRELSSL